MPRMVGPTVMSAAPHVVHVIDSLGVGGTENGLVNLVGALAGDFRHTIVCMTQSGPLADRLLPDVPVHVIGKRPGVDRRALFRLTVLLRRLRPDIVHSRNWGAFDAVLAGWLARVPVAIHGEHGREISDPHGLRRRRNALRRLCAPMVDRFVAVSDDLTRWLISTVGVPRRKVVTIHNGVDVERFAAAAREDGRRTLGVAPESVAVGTVGRLDPVKDQATLLEAFAVVASEHRHATLHIIGDGPCRDALHEQAHRLGLNARVAFLGERRDVATLLSGFDVFVLPSIAEGISNTILEAMAAGLPIVATRTGGNPELVEDRVSGTLVPVGDHRRLAAALSAYTADPHLRALHGKAARQRAMEEFALDRMAVRYRNLYRTLVTGRT